MKRTHIMKKITLGVMVCLIVATSTVSAQTRSFVFHMNTSYAHGVQQNCGYAASKADTERKAYVTVTQFDKYKSPNIITWVSRSGSVADITYHWTWAGTGAHTLDYKPNISVWTGMQNQLVAEQLYSGTVTFGGRWTP